MGNGTHYPFTPNCQVMKTNPLIIVVAAISLAGVANAEEKRKPIRPDNRVEIPEGQKGPRHPNRPLPPEMMQKFDKDGDGKLNEAEKEAMKKAMRKNHEKRGSSKGPGGPEKRPKGGEGDGNPGVLGQ